MEFLFGIVIAALMIVPFWMILPRAGLSPYLSIIAVFVPLGTIILLWVLALRRWPGDPAR